MGQKNQNIRSHGGKGQDPDAKVEKPLDRKGADKPVGESSKPKGGGTTPPPNTAPATAPAPEVAVERTEAPREPRQEPSSAISSYVPAQDISWAVSRREGEKKAAPTTPSRAQESGLTPAATTNKDIESAIGPIGVVGKVDQGVPPGTMVDEGTGVQIDVPERAPEPEGPVTTADPVQQKVDAYLRGESTVLPEYQDTTKEQDRAILSVPAAELERRRQEYRAKQAQVAPPSTPQTSKKVAPRARKKKAPTQERVTQETLDLKYTSDISPTQFGPLEILLTPKGKPRQFTTWRTALQAYLKGTHELGVSWKGAPVLNEDGKAQGYKRGGKPRTVSRGNVDDLVADHPEDALGILGGLWLGAAEAGEKSAADMYEKLAEDLDRYLAEQGTKKSDADLDAVFGEAQAPTAEPATSVATGAPTAGSMDALRSMPQVEQPALNLDYRSPAEVKSDVVAKLNLADREAAEYEKARKQRAAEEKKAQEEEEAAAEKARKERPAADVVEEVKERLGVDSKDPGDLLEHLGEMSNDEIEAFQKVLADRPRSAIRQAIEENISRIFEFINREAHPLSGDKPIYDPKTHKLVRVEHSPEVQAAISETLAFFGWGKTSKYAEKMLFKAVLLYRGIATDRNGRIFGKDASEFKLNDDAFILALKEMRNNVTAGDGNGFNHPFAYTNPHYRIAGTECFPLPMTRDVAEFFAKVTGQNNRLKSTVDDLLKYSVDQWKDVEERLDTVAPRAQREALRDFYDTIAAVPSHPAKPHQLDERVTASEMADVDSILARFFNSPEALVENMRKRRTRELIARKAMDKIRKKMGYDVNKTPSEAKDGDESEDAFGLAFADFTEPRPAGVLKVLTNLMRANGILASPVLAPSGFVEKGTGIADRRGGTWLLRKMSGYKNVPTERSMELVTSEYNIEAYEDILRILVTFGWDGVIDAAAGGVEFKKRQEGLTGRAADFVLKLSTGDLGWKHQTMKTFLDHYILVLERQAEQGGPVYTPQQVEAWLDSNPADFWREVARSDAGREALLHAANTSMGGIDPLTNLIRVVLSNEITDFMLASAFSPYLKFGVRSMIKMTPFSNAMMYAANYGVTALGVRMGRLSPEEAQALRGYSLAADEDFVQGLAQNTIMDIPRAGYQAGTLLLVLALSSMFGVEPPDDEDEEGNPVDKAHLWYEYKIGGKAIKTNWYWNEILGFAMPTAIAIHVAKDGDMDLACQIWWNGVTEQIMENPLLNVVDMVDFVKNLDKDYIVARDRAEGFQGGAPDALEYAYGVGSAFAIRKLSQIFEPAIFRQLYGGAGVFTGQPDMRRSVNMVYTPEAGDVDQSDGTPKLMPTTWSDAQIRRETLRSPTAGLIMNAVQWFGSGGNKNFDSTGYLRSQMPLATIADPTNQVWFDTLSVYDEKGVLVEDEQKWTPEQIKSRTALVLKILNRYSAGSDIAAQGIVIPYGARYWAVTELYRQKNEVMGDFFARDAAGEWYPAYELKNKIARNKAYEKMYAKKQELDKKIDLLFDKSIPYGSIKYNQWEGNWRALYTWKEGTPKAGQPANQLESLIYGDKVQVDIYHAGDHKSSWLPVLFVDDQGQDTYDSQTQAAWQTSATDMDFVKESLQDKTIRKGFNEGRNAWDIVSGEGAVGPGHRPGARWDTNKLLAGARALMPEVTNPKVLNRNDFKQLAAEPATKGTGNGSTGYRRYRGGGGGGGYSPSFYSHPAYNLNADKPQGLYSKTPSYVRFDYLRPKVETKGSREAYRREDF